MKSKEASAAGDAVVHTGHANSTSDAAGADAFVAFALAIALLAQIAAAGVLVAALPPGDVLTAALTLDALAFFALCTLWHRLGVASTAAALPVHESGPARAQEAALETVHDALRQVASGTYEQLRSLREELGILRVELDARRDEVAMLRLGHEFHARRTVLGRLLRALCIVEEDEAHGTEPSMTLLGVRTELEECLDDNGISAIRPTPGAAIDAVVGFDPRHAVAISASTDDTVGTVASVERAAYVVTGPSGHREVLIPPRVRIFTSSSAVGSADQGDTDSDTRPSTNTAPPT